MTTEKTFAQRRELLLTRRRLRCLNRVVDHDQQGVHDCRLIKAKGWPQAARVWEFAELFVHSRTDSKGGKWVWGGGEGVDPAGVAIIILN